MFEKVKTYVFTRSVVLGAKLPEIDFMTTSSLIFSVKSDVEEAKNSCQCW